MSSKRVATAGWIVVAALAVGACSSSSSKQSAGPTTTAPAAAAPSTTTAPPSATATTQAPIAATTDARWTALPPAPLTARSGTASAWTGSAFVVWGGRDGSYRALSNGAWYDPITRRWHPMRAAPFGAETASDFDFGFGLGHMAVIVAGTKAAAYTPATDSWRSLPTIPLQTIDGPAIAQPGAPPWAMLSGADRAGHGAVAWLDPADPNQWHTVELHARAPMVLLANRNVAYWYEDKGAKRSGVELDLANGAERDIQPMPAALFHGYPFAPGTVAGSLVISPMAQVSWNATTGAFARLPVRSTGPTSALASGYCGSATAWTGRELLTWGGSECQGNSYLDTGAEYDPSTGSLRPLSKFLSGRTNMAFAWTGSAFLIWGGETGLNDRVTATGAALTLSPNH